MWNRKGIFITSLLESIRQKGSCWLVNIIGLWHTNNRGMAQHYHTVIHTALQSAVQRAWHCLMPTTTASRNTSAKLRAWDGRSLLANVFGSVHADLRAWRYWLVVCHLVSGAKNKIWPFLLTSVDTGKIVDHKWNNDVLFIFVSYWWIYVPLIPI